MMWMWWVVASAQAPRSECYELGWETGLSWATKADMIADEAKRSAAELRPPLPVNFAWAGFVHNFTDSIDEAMPGRYLAVVKDSAGAELVRIIGQGQTPSHPGSRWMGDFFFASRTAGTFPLRVYVVDRITSKRCEWEVSEAGVMALVKPTPIAPVPTPTLKE